MHDYLPSFVYFMHFFVFIIKKPPWFLRMGVFNVILSLGENNYNFIYHGG